MKTAVDYIIDQLWAPCRGIPSHIIEEAKQLEKEQITKAYSQGYGDGVQEPNPNDDYYNQTYGKDK